MPRQLLNFSLSDYLIRIFTINSYIKWQTVQSHSEANWSGSTLFAKTDLDLHCLQRQGKAGFSRTRFMGGNQIWCFLKRVLRSKLFPFRAYFFSEGGWCVEKETNRKSQQLSPLQETCYWGVWVAGMDQMHLVPFVMINLYKSSALKASRDMAKCSSQKNRETGFYKSLRPRLRTEIPERGDQMLKNVLPCESQNHKS